ncbi:MAG: Flp pilus assembly complex ATPase component TadA [Candidatus Omnitrophica bacterium]|nr:Flp pilus assembly complex ATPase component TadA [Candidatus Omnitrophota bacterium]
MSSLRERLQEILIKNKLISEDDLKLALQVQKEHGGKLSDCLVKLNLINERDLLIALSEGLGFPPISLSRFKIEPEVLKLIPKDMAKHYQIIPVAKMGKSLTVAMADPLNIFAIDDVKTMTGFEINPIIAQQKEILATIEQYYEEPATQAIDDIIKDISDMDIEVVRAGKEGGFDTQELMRLTKEAPVIKITNLLLERGIEMGASDILIEPWERSMRVRVRIDGILREIESPPVKYHASIVSRIKVMSELDIAEHRLPQDGRFKIKLVDRFVDFRVSILPSFHGEKVALRILDKSTATLDIDRLGFDTKTLATIKSCSDRPHGMILASGPTGSGKTTTLYSILKYVDTAEDNIVTVEDPVEYQLEGINQVSIRPEIGLTFASCLRSILRQDPDIIMVGEIRDFETVDIAIKSALTGHLVLSTLHTTTAAGSVIRLVNMGVEPFLITSSVVCLINQRLVRKVCDSCKESYPLTDVMIETLGIKRSGKAPILAYRGKGCKRCFNIGYSGRIVIGEVLTMTATVKDLVIRRAQEYELKKAARLEGMQTLRENGVAKVLEGVTTLEEVLRVTAPDEPIT